MSWQTGCKVDTVSYASLGVFSKVYGVGEEANIANQIASLGFLEDAPLPSFEEIISPMRALFKVRQIVRGFIRMSNKGKR